MKSIVTGSFGDFAGAARGASALVAAGFGHGEVSIIACLPRRMTPAAALIAGALGAMIASGSAFAWAADTSALFAIAPSFGAVAGACLGSVAAMLTAQRSRARAEVVRVFVDESRAVGVEAILRACGATLGRRAAQPRADAPPVLRFVPFRP
jgi:hypothetical protein